MQEVGRFQIPTAHPCLPGHFPGRPVVPGVVLLDAAFTMILAGFPGHSVASVTAVKFTAPVRPDQEVTVLHGNTAGDAAGDTLAFACTVAGRPVLRGTLRLGLGPA